jgi:hypothetical protein
MKHITQNEIELLKDNYPKFGSGYCMKLLNISKNRLFGLTQKLGLKLLPETRSRISSEKNFNPLKKQKVNPAQFISPTNPLICYILGLLWADGTINFIDTEIKHKNTVSLATTFPDSIYFKSLFLQTGDWGIWEGSGFKKTWKPRCNIYTNNHFLAKFLYENDYKSKSFKSADKILSIIPEQLQKYFFLGVTDGDGCFIFHRQSSHYTYQISSGYDQDWNYFINLCKKLQIEYSIHRAISRRGHKSSSFVIYGIYNVKKIGEYLYSSYKEDNIGLFRKYEKYLEIIDRARTQTSKYKYVSRNRNGWIAYYKSKPLGYFKTENEAYICAKTHLENLGLKYPEK